eukprot:COSAG01_NODE_297_length_19258_cov_8.905110_10_plen_78_part_00
MFVHNTVWHSRGSQNKCTESRTEAYYTQIACCLLPLISDRRQASLDVLGGFRTLDCMICMAWLAAIHSYMYCRGIPV